MYPILEYSSTYLILEYYAYFHTNTLYIYPDGATTLTFLVHFLNLSCVYGFCLSTHASNSGCTKEVPVNAFCAQQAEPHDYLGSESSVHILEGLRGAHL